MLSILSRKHKMTVLLKISCLMCVAALSNSVAAKVISLDELPKLKTEQTAATYQLMSLTENTTTTKDCPELNVVVDKMGEIVTLTVNIITGTVNTVYDYVNGTEICDELTGFRCFLRQFHTIYTTFGTVVESYATYGTDVSSTATNVKNYFDLECWK